MKKFLLIVLCISSVCLRGYAQQDPLYAQYLNNPLSINPAYAGLNDNFNVAVGYRTQWAGFDGHPTTFNLNSHISLVDNKVGAGFVLSSDRIGNATNTEFQGAFSYKLQLDDKTFSFGMQGGVINFRSANNLVLAQPDDAVFMQNANVTKPNIGAGVILKSERYFIGLSAPRLLSTDISVTSITGQAQDVQLYNQHYYLFGSYVFYLNEHIRFKPSTLLKLVKGAPASVDLNLNLNFNANYTAGVYTRNFKSYGLLLQALFGDKYKLGYAFEVPTNKSVGASYSTHELYLGMVIPVLKFHQRSVSNF